uniref:Uncharacterized protein n=1 Tax=Cacopsylla melanoneura TaxID=428564 RepID=A0A8D8XGY2_9HEMI
MLLRGNILTMRCENVQCLNQPFHIVPLAVHLTANTLKHKLLLLKLLGRVQVLQDTLYATIHRIHPHLHLFDLGSILVPQIRYVLYSGSDSLCVGLDVIPLLTQSLVYRDQGWFRMLG